MLTAMELKSFLARAAAHRGPDYEVVWPIAAEKDYCSMMTIHPKIGALPVVVELGSGQLRLQITEKLTYAEGLYAELRRMSPRWRHPNYEFLLTAVSRVILTTFATNFGLPQQLTSFDNAGLERTFWSTLDPFYRWVVEATITLMQLQELSSFDTSTTLPS